MNISGWERQVRKGLMELAVLNLLRYGWCHGFQVLKVLKGGPLDMRPGNLYTILARLAKKGYLKSHRERSPTGPMRRCYSMTEAGRRALAQMNARWDEVRGEVDIVIEEGK